MNDPKTNPGNLRAQLTDFGEDANGSVQLILRGKGVTLYAQDDEARQMVELLKKRGFEIETTGDDD